MQGVCKTKIVFVTVAFGIGVDIPSIRRVFHSGVPKTMEEYFQETCRAGRDGKEPTATLFYNGRDVGRGGGNPVDDIMRKFTTAQSCKREIILIALQIRHQKELCYIHVVTITRCTVTALHV